MDWTTRIATVLLLAGGAVLCSPTKDFPEARLSEAEWGSYHEREPEGPGTYAFGYDVEDPATGNTQFRQEQRHPDGSVTGSYGSVQPDGNVQVVHYTADHLGYRVRIENSIRKNEDFPPHPVEPSSEFESALASQHAPASSVHEQHVRPISEQGSQGQHDARPITAQGHRPVHDFRPITSHGHRPLADPRPITTLGNKPLYDSRPITAQGHRPAIQDGRPIGSQGDQGRPINAQNLRGTTLQTKFPGNHGHVEAASLSSNQGFGAFQKQYPIANQGISKVRKVYPINDQDLRRQFSRPSDWQKSFNFDFNYV